MYKTWLRDSLYRLGPKKTRSGLARHLGKSPAFVTRILDYGQKIPADMLPQIANYLGVGLPSMTARADYRPSLLVDVEVAGVLAMGHWSDKNAARLQTGRTSVPVEMSPRFAERKHYSMEVHTSEVAGLDVGDYAVFVKTDNDTLVDGQIVHIVTSDHGKDQDVARRVTHVSGQVMFAVDKTVKGKKPSPAPLAPNERVEGILVSKYRDFVR